MDTKTFVCLETKVLPKQVADFGTPRRGKFPQLSKKAWTGIKNATQSKILFQSNISAPRSNEKKSFFLEKTKPSEDEANRSDFHRGPLTSHPGRIWNKIGGPS